MNSKCLSILIGRSKLIEDVNERNLLQQKALYLAYFTVLYNILEGLVSLWFGINDESFALAGFGADALIEVASAVVVILKLRGDRITNDLNLERERKSTMIIGQLFVLLALITLITSSYQIYLKNHPDTTVPGLIISTISLSFMVFLWRSKLKVGRKLKSSTILSDASCSLACIKLSVVLFVGSVLFNLSPNLWWVDSFAALILAILIGMEGIEMIQNSLKSDFTGGCGCS